MPKLVQDDGQGGESLVIIGEAPGRREEHEGRPFVGPSGYRMLDWMRMAGLERKDAYLTNVYPYYPHGPIEKVPKGELVHWVDVLHDRIAMLTDPIVIVPTGNVALRALTGKAYFPWESKRRGKGKQKITVPGILSHRGSIYEYVDLNGRSIKVIPTVHPAATFRTPKWEKRCILDWAGIADDLTFRGLRLPERNHIVDPTIDILYECSNQLRPEHKITIDIEWLPGGYTLCVGFATSANESLTVPTTTAYWGDKGDLWEAWTWIKSMCEGPHEKILQHGHSDAYVLKRMHDIEIRNRVWDTLAMHHALDPNDDHDLAYLASILTRQRYWKAEAKDPDEIRKYASDMEALLVYNGIDCCVTHEIWEVLYDRLMENGLLEAA